MTGHHESLTHDETVKPPSEKSFGITFAVVFGLIAAWLYWRKDLPVWALICTAAAVFFLVAGFLTPALLRPINLVWLKFGLILHKIVNPIVMGLLFFVVFTPMGFIMRLAGKDPLKLKRDAAAPSYWSPREQTSGIEASMKNQF
jgi:predicted membrane metal-binding protein